MAIKDRLIQYVLRGKDELSPAAGQASEAMEALTKEAEKLGEALDTAKQSRNMARDLSSIEREIDLAEGLRSMLRTGDQFEALSQRITSLMGSVEAGQRATAWIKQFAKETPLEIADVTEAFALLKSYGMDPMDGALQKLTDKSEQLGGGQERLSGIVTAVGQAWAKQKLQTEEILQLVERGVPVWELLGNVTGKTTAQLQDMATKGQLGRDVIKSLIDEIGRSAQGAAAAGMDRLGGKVSNLSDLWADFQNRIARSGALEYVKGRLDALSDTIARLTIDGTLDRWAKGISDAFVGMARAIEGAGQWVARHTTAIKTLAAAYTVLKLANAVAALAKWAVSAKVAAAQTAALTSETNALAAAQARLSAAQALSAIKGGLLTKAAQGIEKVIRGLASFAGRLAGVAGLFYTAYEAGGPLGEMFAKMSPTVKEAEAAVARMNEQLREQASDAQKAAEALAGAADIQIKSTADLRKASDDERAAYQNKLKSLEDYRKAQFKAALWANEAAQQDLQAIKDQGSASTEALLAAEKTAEGTAAALESARQGLGDVKKAMADVAGAAKFASDAMAGQLTPGALELITHFDDLARSGKSADKALADLGQGFDPRSTDQLRDMGVAMQYLSQYGKLSGDQINQFLTERLKGLSGEELARLEEAARDAFKGVGRDAESLGITLDALEEVVS